MKSNYDGQPGQESSAKNGIIRYNGVGGWLLFICLSFTLIFPSIIFLSLWVTWGYEYNVFNVRAIPVLKFVFIICSFLSILIVLYSIYTGIKLWLVHSGALRNAKRYLWCYLGYLVFTLALPYLVWIPLMYSIPQELSMKIIFESVKDLTIGVLYFIACYLFLLKSKRVKEIYHSG